MSGHITKLKGIIIFIYILRVSESSMVMSGHITRLKGSSIFIYILRVSRKQYGHEWPYN